MGLKDDLSNKKSDEGESFLINRKKLETICCKLKINFLKENIFFLDIRFYEICFEDDME